MRVYTVTGLVDDGTGDLYVAAVLPGRHKPEDTATTVQVNGKTLTRFAGFFDAEEADEAERLAVSLVSQYADDSAAMWSPNGRRIEDTPPL